MKRLICIFLVLFILLSVTTGCAKKEEKTELTDADMAYIDTVYEYMSQWDCSVYDSGEHWRINKIAFYDYDGTNRICFYVNFPITDAYGWGYFVDKDKMTSMNFSVYQTDDKTRNRGWLTRTAISGTEWNSKATKDEKYQKLKDAFLYFKKNNIYKK